MKIALVTEMELSGKVPPGFTNMRVEFCWAKALGADFVPYHRILEETYDRVLFVLPKKTRQYDKYPESYKQRYPETKIGIVQEGPITLYEDWHPLAQEIYFQALRSVDTVFVHNKADRRYLLTMFPALRVGIFPTIIDDSLLKDLPPGEFKTRDGIMLSGNMSSWYGGMFSYQMVKDMSDKITIPGSGRITEEERKWVEETPGLNISPWCDWFEWMYLLNQYKIGMNFMPTRAAGTFALNCAYLGIPCFGFMDLDTQNQLFPRSMNLTRQSFISPSFQPIPQETIRRLLTDEGYYNELSQILSEKAKEFTVEKYRPYFAQLMENM